MSARARNEIEELYRGHRDAVYRFLLRDLRDPDEAEDDTQTAFLQAYRSVLRGGRPARPRAWLLAIAANVRRRRFVRAQRRVREVPLDAAAAAAPDPPPVDELRDALALLPANQRAAVVLREVAGLSYDEIARRLGVSVGSVQMLLFRARRTLRDELAPRARRATPLLHWPAALAQQLERVAPAARAAGVAAAAAVAGFGAPGSAPAAAAPDPHDARPPVAASTVPRQAALRERPRPVGTSARVETHGRARLASKAAGTGSAPPAAPIPTPEPVRPAGGAEAVAPRLLPSLPAAPPPAIPAAPLPAEPLPELPAQPPLPAVPGAVAPGVPALP